MSGGDVATTVREVAENLQKLKTAYDASKLDECNDFLLAIKKRLIFFPTYLNPAVESKTRSEELMLTREALEYGVLCSAKKKDLVDFELYYNQLQVYYSDISPSELPQSPHYLMIVGLNLVSLLVNSRIAQFHSELEKIPYDVQASDGYIRFAVQMERFLMEGSYNKLLNSRKRAPSNEYIPVVEMLEQTVRSEVALCVPHAYTVLSLPAAQKVLMVNSPEEALVFGRKYNWQLSPDQKSFVFTREVDQAKHEIPYVDMIKEQISFAASLQNIV